MAAGIAAISPVARAETAQPVAQRLFAYTQDAIAPAGDPGAAVVLADRHGVIACRGFGVDGSGRPVTCRTPFVIASLTKSFTAIATLQLAASGRIRLDAPIERYIPWFRAADRYGPVSVRDFLNQRSGLSESSGLAWLAKRYGGSDVTIQRIHALSPSDFQTAPGTRFEYSNANYDVLGLLVAVVSRQSYEAYVMAHILRPLHLGAAHFSCRGEPHGYVRVFSRPERAGNVPELCADAPAGGLVMTAAQYGRYIAANLDAGRTWSASVLNLSGWAELQRSPRDMPYAMGWYETFFKDGTRELRHAGSAPDYRTFAVMYPTIGRGAALFTDANEVPDGGRATSLEHGFSLTLLGETPPRQPIFPPDLYLRIALLGFAALVLSGIRRVRRSWRARAAQAALYAALAAAILWYAMPKWGGSPAVGFAYSPDLTVLVFLVGASLIAGSLSSLIGRI